MADGNGLDLDNLTISDLKDIRRYLQKDIEQARAEENWEEESALLNEMDRVEDYIQMMKDGKMDGGDGEEGDEIK